MRLVDIRRSYIQPCLGASGSALHAGDAAALAAARRQNEELQAANRVSEDMGILLWV